MAEENESKSKAADPQAKPSVAKAEKSPTDTAAKAAAKPKKEKPPALEKKPFTEFMQQHYLPSLEQALKSKGLDDMQLEFEKRKLELMGAAASDEYWQVTGRWKQGQRQFNIAFMKEDISGQKVFSYADNGAKPSTLEQFMGDERKITLDLLVLYTLQRLNGQKWLTRN